MTRIANVSIKKNANDYKLYTLSEFKEHFTIVDRVQLIQKGAIEFIDFDGNKIKLSEAIRLLNQA
ncbi:MAG: hypothetical protein AAF551_01645 [Bacteroidota bacterium]